MTPHSTIQVWDPLVRLFHWSLVLTFIVAYASGEEWLALHVATGYAIGGLLIFRIVWGIVGPGHARFSDFVRSPSAIRAYLQDLVRLRAPRYLGHNPAGGAMVVALLASLTVATVSGLALYGSSEFAGPLQGLVSHAPFWADVLKGLHEAAANLTVLLIVLHVGGVLVSSLLHRENLVRAMISGRKPEEVTR
jgi:cytochrome b